MKGVIWNQEWTRMGTNEGSSGFPARDLSAATGLPGLTLQGEGGRRDCSILPGFLWEPVELTEIWK